MPPFELTLGAGPLVAAAVHDGHSISTDTLPHIALPDLARLREEDPFTGEFATVAPTRIIGTHSRFEVDLNRPPERSIYKTPDDAWGLTVWKDEVPRSVVEQSSAMYTAFYDALGEVLDDKVRRHGAVVVYDLHTYNHRRDGPDGGVADPDLNPEVNLGTGTMVDRARWTDVVDGFMTDLMDGARETGMESLDVRENVKFKGGQVGKWIHERYGRDACVLSIEFKKTFMDEWSGEPDRAHLNRLRAALAHTIPGTLRRFESVTARSTT